MRRFLLLLLTMFFCCSQLLAGWQENVFALLDRGFNDIATASCREMSVSPDEVIRAVKEIKDSSQLLNFLQRRDFKTAGKLGELELFNLVGKDGFSRPCFPEFGRCRWLSIEGILPEPAAEWHIDHNLAMVSDRVPAPELYFPFKREAPSAAVKVAQIGNRFFLAGSRVGRLRLLLQKDQLNFLNPVEVFYNDQQVFSGLVVPDSGLILSDYLQNRDRELLAVAAIDLDFRREKEDAR